MQNDEAKKPRILPCLAGLVCWNLAVSIDSTALSVVLPSIAKDLHATSTSAYWTGTSFVLCSAVFQPVLASMSGIFGRGSVLLFGLLLFAIGAIICGIARNIGTLLAGRCIQGSGGGCLLTMTYVVMADLFSLQERSKYQGIISLTWLVGTVLGPVMGGGFAEKATWVSITSMPNLEKSCLTRSQRWIFWINLPFCAIAFVLVVVFMRSKNSSDRSILEQLKSFDWAGSFLLGGSLTSFLIAISWVSSILHTKARVTVPNICAAL